MSLKDLEALAKVVGIVIAVFTIMKYFNDQRLLTERAQATQTQSLIDEYGGAEITRALSVYNETVESIHSTSGQQQLNRRDFDRLVYIYAHHSNAKKFRDSIFKIQGFYSKVEFCVLQNLCDPELTRAHFCRLRSSLNSSFAAVEAYYASIGLSTISQGDKNVWKDCKNHLASVDNS